MAKDRTDGVDDNVTLAQVLDRLARITEENHALQSQAHLVQREQLKQTRRKSNQSAPLASVFNPRGEKDFPMPRLKCDVWMPFPQRPELHGMDREEVELMNLLIDDVSEKLLAKQAPEYAVELNDDSTVTLCIDPIFNRTTRQLERIRWCGPTDPDTRMPTPFFTTENRQQFRSLRALLRHILGDKALGVMPMKVEYQKVKEFAALDVIDREDRTTHAEAYEKRPTATHVGPLAMSIGE